ncbi:MAG: hypothetical protein OES84_00030 [Kiritimatiellaceae bacterium]|nr:hypothetical protein [Kiritimatiellaceae bacterium]
MNDKILPAITITLAGAIIINGILGAIYQSGVNSMAKAERAANKDNIRLNYNKNLEQDKKISQIEKVYITIGEMKRDNQSILNNIKKLRTDSEKYNEWRLRKEHIINDAGRYIQEKRE